MAETGQPGRPPIYDPLLADELLARIATGSRGMQRICQEDEDMPSHQTAWKWVRDDIDGFAEKYARAKRFQAHVLVDEIIDIADCTTEDWVKRLAYNGPVPEWEMNGLSFHTKRIKIDARKWLAAKLLPKEYGDNQPMDQTLNVRVDRNITVTYVNPPAVQGPRNPPPKYQPAIEAQALQVEGEEEFIDEWEDEG